MEIVRRRDLLVLPADVRDEERGGPRHAGQLVVVEEDDPGGAEQSSEIPEVDEDAVEAMVSIDDGNVEAAAFLEKARQRELGRPRVELDEIRDACLVEELQSDVAEPGVLVRVEHEMPRLGRAGID